MYKKKRDRFKKENCRLISSLPHVSKSSRENPEKTNNVLYEWLAFKLNDWFPKVGTMFQQCFVKILENWKNALDKGDSVCTLLKDLSKAFD